MWNSLDLICPKEDLSEYRPHERYLVEELQDFVTVLTTAADTLTSENPLWSEMKVLHNIQVKYKRILRCDKCLIYLQRVAHCLKKMVLLNLSKSYLDIAERFLVGLQDPSITYHLPSRQQVEYLLIRTLTASKLVCEAIKYSREAFCYLVQKLKVGHLILDLVMATSVIARMNILLQAILQQLGSVYKQVLPWRYKIKRGTFDWADKLDLPQNIEEWLKTFDQGYLKPLPMSKDEIDRLSLLANQKNENNVGSDSESIVLVEEVVKQNGATANIFCTENTDYGEVVCRKEAKRSHNLTDLQNSMLEKIVSVRSLKDLEEVWNDIINFPRDHFPVMLTKRKKEVINLLFTHIKNTAPLKKFKKTYKKEPAFLKTAISIFSKHLGFKKAQIEKCKKTPGVLDKIGTNSKLTQLVPVKTIKKFKILYKELCAKLKFTGETEKRRKLRKIFKRRIADVALLKQNGEAQIAKRLLFCTSKEFLSLCQ